MARPLLLSSAAKAKNERGEKRGRRARAGLGALRRAGDDDEEDVIGLALRAAAANSGVAALLGPSPLLLLLLPALRRQTRRGSFAPLFAGLCCCSRPGGRFLARSWSARLGRQGLGGTVRSPAAAICPAALAQRASAHVRTADLIVGRVVRDSQWSACISVGAT